MNNTAFANKSPSQSWQTHKDLLQGQNSVVMPYYNACFWNLQVAALDPIDHVQSRSRTKCVDWLAKFNGIAAIHAVFPAVRNVEQEEISVKLVYQSSDSQEWPCTSSLDVCDAECPDCE